MPTKANGKVIFWSVAATLLTMWAIHKVDMFEGVRSEIGLDD
ncbi:hypothetical protein [Photobacterium damselae]|nr:hypothetical protein [Photobacterium damselae]TGZ34026.1 hypothetical protein EQ875_02592 [Photobacterium damselae subsp. damselae]SPY31598.1 Uncharacterised protein [Photobacterium damselae]